MKRDWGYELRRRAIVLCLISLRGLSDDVSEVKICCMEIPAEQPTAEPGNHRLLVSRTEEQPFGGTKEPQ